MKKIVSFLVALTLLASGACLSVYADMVDGTSSAFIQNTTDARDLQAYGLHTFASFKAATTPSVDGAVNTGEYPGVSDVAKPGDGLWLTGNDGSADNAGKVDGLDEVVLETYLAYDDTYAYIAEKVTSPVALPSTVSAWVRYGLNQSKLIPEAYSHAENKYKITSSNVISIDSSNANAKSRTYLNGLGNLSRENMKYFDGTTEWKASTYKSAENAAFTRDGDTFIFEYRLPLADIAYSAFGEFSQAKTAELIASGQFFGSYSFSFTIGGSNYYLSTAIPGNAKADAFSGDDSKTWTEALQEYYTDADGNNFEQKYLPSPVWHFPTSDPSSAVIPAGSSFRNGGSGIYGFDNVPSVFRMVNSEGQYKKGDYNRYYTFTLLAAGTENTDPYVGDTRTIPVTYRVRSGYNTKLQGTFANFNEGSFDASKLPSGLYTLVVTFTTQEWDGTQWVDTGVTRNFARNITIAGSARAASASSQTGDAVIFIISGILVAAAAVTGAVLLSKKRRKISF